MLPVNLIIPTKGLRKYERLVLGRPQPSYINKSLIVSFLKKYTGLCTYLVLLLLFISNRIWLVNLKCCISIPVYTPSPDHEQSHPIRAVRLAQHG